MRRLALAAVPVACLAFLAAGCGGKSQPAAVPTNDWANSVCGALVTWTTTVKSLATNIKSNPTKAGLQDAVTQAEDATKTLSSSLKSLGKPDTSVGQQAKSDISTLADELTGRRRQDQELGERRVRRLRHAHRDLDRELDAS